MIKAAFKQAQIYHDHFKGQLNSIMWLNPMFTWRMVANLKYMAPSCIFKLPNETFDQKHRPNIHWKYYACM